MIIFPPLIIVLVPDTFSKFIPRKEMKKSDISMIFEWPNGQLGRNGHRLDVAALKITEA